MKINNQISADIQFIGSCVKKIKISNDIIHLDDDAIREFNMDINVDGIGRDENNFLIGTVNLGIIIYVKNKKDKRKTKIDIVVQGCFTSTNIELLENKFNAMLYINGGSALYSIARALVCGVSANIFESGKLLLPMVNIIEFMKEKIEEESQTIQEVVPDQSTKPSTKKHFNKKAHRN